MATMQYFTPGPSAIYFTLEDHIKTALKEQIPSISHRSRQFKSIYQHTAEQLRLLMNVPEDYHILFTGSATEIWERLIQNCIQENSYHLVNGAFSEKFHSMALAYKKNAVAFTSQPGSCASPADLAVPENCELIALTQNETSTGAAQPLEDIYQIRNSNPGKLLCIDGVSSLPFIDLDFSQIDSAYFSVQKCFGLPAGLGVWIVNQKCIDKAIALENKGLTIGQYHSLPSLVDQGKQFQTPETPNVLNIYLLGKVAEDMLYRGIKNIRNETEYKAAILYNTIEKNPLFEAFVKEKRYQSKTVIVAETKEPAEKIISYLNERNLQVGSGYGSFKKNHIRIANFPAHSKEQIEGLVDAIEKI